MLVYIYPNIPLCQHMQIQYKTVFDAKLCAYVYMLLIILIFNAYNLKTLALITFHIFCPNR